MIRHVLERLRVGLWAYALSSVLVLGNFLVARIFHREPVPSAAILVGSFVIGVGIGLSVKR